MALNALQILPTVTKLHQLSSTHIFCFLALALVSRYIKLEDRTQVGFTLNTEKCMLRLRLLIPVEHYNSHIH